MWLSCSSFFQQFFHCYCPVRYGRKADPNGDYIRWLLWLCKPSNHYYWLPLCNLSLECIMFSECHRRIGNLFHKYIDKKEMAAFSLFDNVMVSEIKIGLWSGLISFFFPYRTYLPALKNFPSKYIHEPWTAPDSVQRAAKCVIGRDYPMPMVDHIKQSQNNIERMKQVYQQLAHYRGKSESSWFSCMTVLISRCGCSTWMSWYFR